MHVHRSTQCAETLAATRDSDRVAKSCRGASLAGRTSLRGRDGPTSQLLMLLLMLREFGLWDSWFRASCMMRARMRVRDSRAEKKQRREKKKRKMTIALGRVNSRFWKPVGSQVLRAHSRYTVRSSTSAGAMIFSRPCLLPTRRRSGSAGLQFNNLPGRRSPPNQILARLDAASSLAPTADLIGCFSSLALTGSNATSSSRQQRCDGVREEETFSAPSKRSCGGRGAAPLDNFSLRMLQC